MALRFDRRMSDSDALMWRIEKDPQLRSTVGMVTLLDQPPDMERLLGKLDYGMRTIPRLRQKVMPVPLNAAPPRWVVDPAFDLSHHLRVLRAPGAGDLQSLLDLMATWLTAGFDTSRPLWEFTVVEGLESGGAALVQKIHHSLTDGVGGVEMAMLFLDFDREGHLATDAPPLPEPEHTGPLALLAEAVGHNLRRNAGAVRRAVPAAIGTAINPLPVARQLGRYATSTARMLAPTRSGLSTLFRARSMSRHLRAISVDFTATKAAGRAVGGTINDAFAAAVAGGLGRYHEAKGSPVEQLRMGIPINLRTEETRDVGGNQFAPARLLVPVGGDAAERMREIGRRIRAARREPALSIASTVAGIINLLPTSLTISIFGPMLRTVDVTTSNVPGSPVPLYMAGAELVANYPFGPTAGAAVNITLLSYRGTLDIGINADAAAVDDPDLLVECLEESFREVHKLAS